MAIRVRKKQTAWQPIKSFAGDPLERVDLWLQWDAWPSTFGMADSFRVPDAWFHAGKWQHRHNGRPTELKREYITHWMPRPSGPNGEERY